MFTGIIEELGQIAWIRPGSSGIKLGIRARKTAKGVKLGDSIAVNGCCLTVARVQRQTRGTVWTFDLLQETWDRTNLKDAVAGQGVNLERSMAANGRFGGHFVTGHIDGVGRITRWERKGADHVLEVEAPASIRPYLVEKGSVAVDGISLTVAAVSPQGFRIWIIPHTFDVTSLRERSVGSPVNLEADLLGKYIARFIEARDANSSNR
ncbi:MAG: riboflavin synthase [Verrucomicrobiales bacterium]|nr:riboflavin synthase [Verrucomicrobiales bacterium]